MDSHIPERQNGWVNKNQPEGTETESEVFESGEREKGVVEEELRLSLAGVLPSLRISRKSPGRSPGSSSGREGPVRLRNASCDSLVFFYSYSFIYLFD